MKFVYAIVALIIIVNVYNILFLNMASCGNPGQSFSCQHNPAIDLGPGNLGKYLALLAILSMFVPFLIPKKYYESFRKYQKLIISLMLYPIFIYLVYLNFFNF